MTLGSLFDGSGTAPLAARMCGVEPIWCSEIEPFPIAVTRARFPNMKHYGNICTIKGDKIEPVDIICGGSPCQDLSVAGKRAGLEGGERSVLFHEQIRLIKEMRNATNDIRPRFAIWENVPGAYSSNGGEDFRCVLEAFCQIADETADIPRPAEGKWAAAGCIVGNGWSVAYRTLDAQYFGVPQRRRRIFLVADFGSECAAEILSFEGGLFGNIAESGEKGESAAGKVEGGVGEAVGVDGYNSAVTGKVVSTLGVNCGMSTGRQSVMVEGGVGEAECWGIDAAIMTGGNCTAQGPCVYKDISATLKASAPHGVCCEDKPLTLRIRSGCEGGGKGALIQTDLSGTLGCNNDQTLFEPICMATQQGGAEIRTDNKAPTLTAAAGMSGNNQPVVCYGIDQQGGKGGANYTVNVMPTLLSDSHGTPHAVCYGICSDGSNSMLSDNPNSGIYIADTARTLDGNGGNPACNQGGIAVVEPIGIKCMTSWDTQTRRVYDPSGVYPSLCSGHDSGQNQQSIIEPQYFENHGQDERYTGPHDIASCVTAGYGMGGSTKPFIVSPDPIKVLPFNERQIASPQNGNNPDYGDPCRTLSATDGAPTVCIKQETYQKTTGPLMANSHPGSYCGQDAYSDMFVTQPIGFDRYNGDITGEVAQTLAGVTRDNNVPHVLYENHQFGGYREGRGTLKASGGDYGGGCEKLAVCTDIVRRLTPKECQRLQGFMDGWCDNISIPNPTESDIAFWKSVWDTYQSINGKKPKSVKQIIKWLKHPRSDSAEYKMWGNGMALPCVLYIMRGIISAERPII